MAARGGDRARRWLCNPWCRPQLSQRQKHPVWAKFAFRGQACPILPHIPHHPLTQQTHLISPHMVQQNSQDLQSLLPSQMQLLSSLNARTAIWGFERCPLVSREESELGVRRPGFKCCAGKSWVNRYLSLGCHQKFHRLGASTVGICAWP